MKEEEEEKRKLPQLQLLLLLVLLFSPLLFLRQKNSNSKEQQDRKGDLLPQREQEAPKNSNKNELPDKESIGVSFFLRLFPYGEFPKRLVAVQNSPPNKFRSILTKTLKERERGRKRKREEEKLANEEIKIQKKIYFSKSEKG